jgi:hypothetical protein
VRHEAPFDRAVRGLAPGRRNGRVELRGSPMPEVRRRAGAAVDDGATVRRHRVGRASKAERRRETESVVEAPILPAGPEARGYGLLGCSILVAARDRLDRPFAVRADEATRRVAVLRGAAPGVELDADPADRLMVNVGSAPAVPAGPLGLAQAHRPLVPPGRGGGPALVVGETTHRGGRESRPHGEGVQWARGTIGWEGVAGEHRRALV